MITKTAFVRANGVVVLDAVTHVCLHVTLIVCPCNTELADSVGDTKALNEVCLLKLGVLVVLFFDGGKNLTDGLDILRLIGESLFEIFYNLCCIHNL